MFDIIQSETVENFFWLVSVTCFVSLLSSVCLFLYFNALLFFSGLSSTLPTLLLLCMFAAGTKRVVQMLQSAFETKKKLINDQLTNHSERGGKTFKLIFVSFFLNLLFPKSSILKKC